MDQSWSAVCFHRVQKFTVVGSMEKWDPDVPNGLKSDGTGINMSRWSQKG